MSRLKRLIKKIDKIVENISIEEIEERIKADEMEEDIKNSFNRIETIMNNEVCEFNKTIIEGNLNVIKRYIENLIKGYKELEIENKTLKAHKNGCPALSTTGVECEFKKDLEKLQEGDDK